MEENSKIDSEARDGIGDFEAYSDPALRSVTSIRSKLYLLVQSRSFQLSVITLVILDCLLVILEVLLDLRVVEMHGDKLPAQILHYMSICILSIFMVEILLKLYVFQLDFFKYKWEVFDALIVIISFSLDVAFRGHFDGLNGIGLLIILRLWRVARILNGIVMSVKKQAHRKLEIELDKRQKLELELSKFNDLCNAQENELKVLRSILDQNNIDYPLTSEIDIIEKPNMLPFREARLSFLPPDEHNSKSTSS